MFSFICGMARYGHPKHWAYAILSLYPHLPLREQHPCQNNKRWCFRNFWNHVLLCPL